MSMLSLVMSIVSITLAIMMIASCNCRFCKSHRRLCWDRASCYRD